MVGVGRRGNAGIVLSVALLAGVLTGCGPSSDTVTEVTEPPPDPGLVFDSDEEALAAAEEAVVWSINTDLAMDLQDEAAIEEYLETLTPDRRDEQRQAFEELAEAGLTTTGKATLTDPELVERTSAPERETVSVRFCLDTSEVAVTAEDGSSAQLEELPPRRIFATEVLFSEVDEFMVDEVQPYDDGQVEC